MFWKVFKELMSTGFIASLKVSETDVGTPVVVAPFAGAAEATVGCVKSRAAPVVKVLVAGVVAGLPFRSVHPGDIEGVGGVGDKAQAVAPRRWCCRHSGDTTAIGIRAAACLE